MNHLHQTFWPSIDDALDTYGQPIGANVNNTKDLTPLRFWQEAYLTSLCGGNNTFAKMTADDAVKDLAQHTGLVYSQNEGGNTPYPPNDEVRRCLSGAIPAMNLLRVELIDRSRTSLCPGLDDLIARSKKALGDC